MIMKKIVLIACCYFPLLAGDVMVERMQSVVDEVSELRKRYEDAVHKNEECLSQVKKQNDLLSQKGLNPSIDKEKIQALEFENTKLKQAHETAKQESLQLKELKSKADKLAKENKRLNTSAQILVDKNQSLLEQLNKLKRNKEEPNNIALLKQDKQRLEKELSSTKKTLRSLEKSNTQLEEQLKTNTSASHTNVLASLLALQEKNKKLLADLNNCKNKPTTSVKRVKNSKSVCTDDNPFPKLLKKEKKTEAKKTVKTAVPLNKEVQTSGVYRVKGESAVYDMPKGKLIEIWEDTRSFTSNVKTGTWIKITGYFVDRKWRKAQREMWVKEENTLKR